MEIFLIVIGVLLLLLGFVGCVIPALPGPPLSFCALLVLHFTEKVQFSTSFLLTWLAVAVVVTLLDNLVPIYGTKKFGGSKKGVWGSVIGLLVGLFFPPFGILVGPFLGAFLGEVWQMREEQSRQFKQTGQVEHPGYGKALKAATGAFLGLLAGIILKLVASGMMTYYFIKAL